MNKEQRFLDAVEKVNTLALTDNGWEAGLGAVSDLLGAVCVSFEIINKRQQEPAFLRMGGDFNRDMGPEYLKYYAGISPRVREVEKYPVGGVSFDYQILSEQEINKDEYYNDFALPQGQRYFVAGHILNDNSHMALFAAQRSPSQGHVKAPEIKLMRRLLPHVQQALNLKFRLAGANQTPAKTFEHLNLLTEAVIAFNAAGEIIFNNYVAEKLFSDKDGIDCQQGVLIFSDRNSNENYTRSLQSLVLKEGQGINMQARDFLIRRPSRKHPYLASLRPLLEKDLGNDEFSFMNETRAVALLFIRDPEYFSRLDTVMLQFSFRLSPQELELAEALDRGLSLHEVAELRAVAISTVRSQLYSLMGKTGVTRQSNLIRLLGQYRRPFQ